VSDENGVRWYFSEQDPGGPSRLECYRRLLNQPANIQPSGSRAAMLLLPVATPLRRLSDLFELAKRNWRGAARDLA
jgi:hypothetical protein